jgi:hypothetical protein
VWFKLLEKQFSEMKLMDNIAKEVSNLVSRSIGWVALDLALYHGHSLLSKRKKRETGETVDTMETVDIIELTETVDKIQTVDTVETIKKDDTVEHLISKENGNSIFWKKNLCLKEVVSAILCHSLYSIWFYLKHLSNPVTKNP